MQQNILLLIEMKTLKMTLSCIIHVYGTHSKADTSFLNEHGTKLHNSPENVNCMQCEVHSSVANSLHSEIICWVTQRYITKAS